ncbi:MAG: HEPN domain-containing protein [Candidatus Andersenbacteria bacterium]|nr:HEPN domain-containing protein [bacterium]MDZ4225368.1 HEPN domain-containing protein [Candidatus Andersenbacteria bacterium]
MRKRPINLTQEWLSRADDDEMAADILLKEQGPPTSICFIAQQMGEKYLKAFLVFKEQEPPKTHDLIALLEKCALYEPKLAMLKDEAALLTEYVVDTRYPGNVKEYSSDEAQFALSAAKHIKKVIAEHL